MLNIKYVMIPVGLGQRRTLLAEARRQDPDISEAVLAAIERQMLCIGTPGTAKLVSWKLPALGEIAPLRRL